MEQLSELSRMIENQAEQTHKRVVERIKELLNVDEITARAYKAWLYSKVKAEKPELNNYDRAVEMEKMTTREILKTAEKAKIDEIIGHITQKTKEREAKMSESENKPTEAKKEKKDTKERKEKKTKKVSRSSKLKGGKISKSKKSSRKSESSESETSTSDLTFSDSSEKGKKRKVTSDSDFLSTSDLSSTSSLTD